MTVWLTEESALIAAAARGDAGAQRMLFRREYPRVSATVARMLGNDPDIDDFVQETFIAVFDALPRFRRESKLSTWIERITVNVVLQHLRSRKLPRGPLTADLAHPASARVVESADAREGLRRLYAGLADMTPASRLAFALYAIDGRSINEVAALTRSSQIAAKVRIWRARREVERRADLDPVLAELLDRPRNQ